MLPLLPRLPPLVPPARLRQPDLAPLPRELELGPFGAVALELGLVELGVGVEDDLGDDGAEGDADGDVVAALAAEPLAAAGTAGAAADRAGEVSERGDGGGGD